MEQSLERLELLIKRLEAHIPPQEKTPVQPNPISKPRKPWNPFGLFILFWFLTYPFFAAAIAVDSKQRHDSSVPIRGRAAIKAGKYYSVSFGQWTPISSEQYRLWQKYEGIKGVIGACLLILFFAAMCCFCLAAKRGLIPPRERMIDVIFGTDCDGSKVEPPRTSWDWTGMIAPKVK